MTTGDHSGRRTGNGTHNDHFGDPAPRPPSRPGPRDPPASDRWLFPGAWPRGAARGTWRPPGCARRTAVVVRAQQPEPRPAPSLPVIGAFILGGGPSGGRERAAAASVRCDLLPPGLSPGPRPRYGHGGLASAAARTSRGAEGKGGPGRRPGAHGGRGEGRGPDGHLQPSGGAADPTSRAEERTPCRRPGLGSGEGPGDPGHRSLWSWITGNLRCAVRASDRRGGRWCPAPSPGPNP